MTERRQCEAFDIVPTDDDAKYVRCPNDGVVITENVGGRYTRRRAICVGHGLELWLVLREKLEEHER